MSADPLRLDHWERGLQVVVAVSASVAVIAHIGVTGLDDAALWPMSFCSKPILSVRPSLRLLHPTNAASTNLYVYHEVDVPGFRIRSGV